MAKFKIGDKVRILDGSNIKDYIGDWISVSMEKYVGTIAIISDIVSDDIDGVSYRLRDNYFLFDERGLELVETSISEELVRINKSINEFLNKEMISSLNMSMIKERNNMNMPDIKDYTYNSKIGLTTIKWHDGTKTVVKAETPDTADQYTGFVTAYSKKAAGNNSKINNLYDKWTIEIPKLKADADKMIEKMKIEEAQKEERNRRKREKYIIHKMALQRKREFEARKLASEKYGIPEDEDLT